MDCVNICSYELTNLCKESLINLVRCVVDIQWMALHLEVSRIGYTRCATRGHTENRQRGYFPSKFEFFLEGGRSRNTSYCLMSSPNTVPVGREKYTFYPVLVGLKVYI